MKEVANTNAQKDVLKEIIKKSFDAKGIKVEELLKNATDYKTKNLIHSLTSDTKLSFKHFRELIELVGLDFSLSVQDGEVPPTFYTVYKSTTDSTNCTKFDTKFDSLINNDRYTDSDEICDEFDGDDLSDEDDDEDDSDEIAEYVDIPVTMLVRIKKTYADNLSRIENHIEEFIDLDSWPEIDSIYEVAVAAPISPEVISNDYK